jgi:hypothetical protein
MLLAGRSGTLSTAGTVGWSPNSGKNVVKLRRASKRWSGKPRITSKNRKQKQVSRACWRDCLLASARDQILPARRLHLLVSYHRCNLCISSGSDLVNILASTPSSQGARWQVHDHPPQIRNCAKQSSLSFPHFLLACLLCFASDSRPPACHLCDEEVEKRVYEVILRDTKPSVRG